MKYKEFAIFRLFGFDVTSRKTYRRRLSLQLGAMKKAQEEVALLKSKLVIAGDAVRAAAEDYNKLKADYEIVRSELQIARKALAEAKRELEKVTPYRGTNGRFAKKK